MFKPLNRRFDSLMDQRGIVGEFQRQGTLYLIDRCRGRAKKLTNLGGNPVKQMGVATPRIEHQGQIVAIEMAK